MIFGQRYPQPSEPHAKSGEDQACAYDVVARLAKRLTAEELGEFAEENARYLRAKRKQFPPKANDS